MMMKKLISILLVLLLACCALAEEDAALLDIAQEMAGQLAALCAVEGYAELYLTDENILSQIKSWGGDWSAPENRARAAVVFLSRDALLTALPAVLREAGVSGDVLEYADSFLQRAAAIPASLINGRLGGTQQLAAASVATLSRVCALEDQDSGIALALLDYGSEHPMILVSFYIAPDGAASISASFAVNGDYADTLFSALDSASALRVLAASALGGEDSELNRALLGALDAARVLVSE